jgi:hypothetical protein
VENFLGLRIPKNQDFRFVEYFLDSEAPILSIQSKAIVNVVGCPKDSTNFAA